MTALPNSTAARDIASLIHPYTNLDRHRVVGPFVIASGDGCYVYDEGGKRYLEGLAGLWSASLGFSEPRLVAAATKQMQRLPYSQIFGGRSHEPAIDLAEKLLSIAPKGLTKALFANSGSEANDQAIKLVWYYHNAIGKPDKKKIISRMRAYHGVTVASASLTGLAPNHADFDLPIARFLHTDCPSHYHHAEPGESEAAFVTRIVGNLEALIEREGPDTVAAFFAEPVMGAGGVIVPPKGYFEAVQRLLKKHDILFVADEVICGFGRTGNMWGSETYGITPDILTCAKALSASFLPISATLVTDRIHEAMLAESRKLGTFGHGFTYAGHPVSSAVALETLKIYEERDIVGHVRRIAPHFQARLRTLADHPLVGEARGVGLVGAVELVRDKAAKTPFDAALAVGPAVQAAVLEEGVILRAIRDVVAVCPPLIITDEQIDTLFDALAKGLDKVHATLAAEAA
ncbi:MAG TPA: aspartate aminotransferase family protein [Caulobacteraceae bacterium]|nr:aspartate aminotransferase family protein [Caulobacteraceae bacterium]